jgi:hypothetical protein
MDSFFSDFGPALTTFVVLLVLFGIVGARGRMLSGAIGTYLIIGIAVAVVQDNSAGDCPDWRGDGSFWRPVIDWPGEAYRTVWQQDMPLRQFLMPRTCTNVDLSPSETESLKKPGGQQ